MKITSLIIIIIMKLFSRVLKNNGLIEEKSVIQPSIPGVSPLSLGAINSVMK